MARSVRASVSDTDHTARVLTSLSGKIWRWRPVIERHAAHIAQHYNLNPLVAHVLAARNVPTETVDTFLQPKLRDCLPDPFSLKDMHPATERILQAIKHREKVALFGDYDVDGATSTALMGRFLRQMGLEPTLYIPDRILEGYGPNKDAFAQLIDAGHTLIITLDCGVLGFEPLRYAAERSCDVVVIDHHMAAAELPPANAIVNPNRLDDTSGLSYLCAVGVTFVTLVALGQKLRAENSAYPDLMQFLDLVALGTVCDVVPMRDLNRALVAQGLKIMAKGLNTGLRVMAQVAALDQAPSTYHLGFVFGPRLNAGGRIANSSLGVTLLSCDDTLEAEALAHTLEQHNRERQQIEKQAVEHAMGIVAAHLDKHSHMIVVAHEDWHPGVIGLIAARLKEQFQRPACVIALDKNGKGKASCRSITGIDFGRLVLLAREQGLIIDGGGHVMAAGFSVKAEQIDALHAFYQNVLIAEFGPALPPPEISVDATCTLAALQLETALALEQLEPFGPGHAAPKLVLSPVFIQRIDVVKEKHLRLSIRDNSLQKTISVMLFNQAMTPLHQALGAVSPQQPLALLGCIKKNTWMGRTEAQFLVDDVALMQMEDIDG